MADQTDDLTDQTTGNTTGSTTSDTTDTDNTSENTENTSVITLVVEDGSGVANANCYSTLKEVDNYQAERGRENWAKLTENQRKVCLILGTDFVDKYYKWYGRRKFRSQEMAFPRVELYDSDDFLVEGIPLVLKKACYEAAYLNVKSSLTVKNGLFTTKDSSGDIKKKKVDSLEVEYFQGSETKVDYTSIYEVLNNFLNGLYKTDNDRITINTGAVWMG